MNIFHISFELNLITVDVNYQEAGTLIPEVSQTTPFSIKTGNKRKTELMIS